MVDGALHNACLRLEASGRGLGGRVRPRSSRRWLGRSGLLVGGVVSLGVGAVLGGALAGVPILLPPTSSASGAPQVVHSGPADAAALEPSGAGDPVKAARSAASALEALGGLAGGDRAKGVNASGASTGSDDPPSDGTAASSGDALSTIAGTGPAGPTAGLTPSGGDAASTDTSTTSLGSLGQGVSQVGSSLSAVSSTASGAVGAVTGALSAAASGGTSSTSSTSTTSSSTSTTSTTSGSSSSPLSGLASTLSGVLQCVDGLLSGTDEACPADTSTSTLGGL
jgi:hypothetical protein